MNQNSKYSYLAKNTMLFTISSFGSKILVFLLVPLYTSILSTTDYGIADTVTTTASLAIYVFTLNIQDAVLRFAIDRGNNPEQCLTFGLRVLCYGSIAFGAILSGLSLLNPFGWGKHIYLFLFLQFFVVALNYIFSYYLRAIDKVKEVAISGIITTLVTIICNIILLLIVSLGINGYLISMVAGSLLSSVYCNIIIGRSPVSLLLSSVDKSIKRQMLVYSIPLIFNAVAWWMNNSIDKYFVIWMIGQAQNGLLAVSYKIPTIMTAFHTIFFQSWNLSAIKEFDPEDKDGFFSKTYTMYNSCLVLICSGLIVLNIPIASVLFAKDFFIAWNYSSVLLLSIVFSALAGFVGSVFTAVKNSKVFAISTVTTAVANCFLNLIMIPVWGVMGAVIATCISFWMIWAIRLICSRKYIKWRIQLGRDIAAYCLLIIQICAEHSENHLYLLQVIIFGFLIFLYRAEFNKMITAIFLKLKQMLNRIQR